MLLVLSNKTLYNYPISALDSPEPSSNKKGKKIQSHCIFFRAGICLGRHLVCCVKWSAITTTVKVYEPNDAMSKTRKQKGLGKMFNAGQDELKAFKEFYIPTETTSVHFLKSKLCVACARGFEVVALETLETQSLLDQADTSLDFVARKEGVKPIHIERLNGEFLLNYSEFSFFVNRNGWRARPGWRIDWEGTPQSFALSYPWILAFEPNFIELRHIDSGAVHIVPHRNIRMLHSSTHEVSLHFVNSRRFACQAFSLGTWIVTGEDGSATETEANRYRHYRSFLRMRTRGARTSSRRSTSGKVSADLRYRQAQNGRPRPRPPPQRQDLCRTTGSLFWERCVECFYRKGLTTHFCFCFYLNSGFMWLFLIQFTLIVFSTFFFIGPFFHFNTFFGFMWPTFCM